MREETNEPGNVLLDFSLELCKDYLTSHYEDEEMDKDRINLLLVYLDNCEEKVVILAGKNDSVVDPKTNYLGDIIDAVEAIQDL